MYCSLFSSASFAIGNELAGNNVYIIGWKYALNHSHIGDMLSNTSIALPSYVYSKSSLVSILLRTMSAFFNIFFTK